MAELADAPGLGPGGQPWGFESLFAHQGLQSPLLFAYNAKQMRNTGRAAGVKDRDVWQWS